MVLDVKKIRGHLLYGSTIEKYKYIDVQIKFIDAGIGKGEYSRRFR